MTAALPRLHDRPSLRGRRPIDSSALLRELRHTDAQAAGGVTTWLHELGLARKSLRTISEYGRIADAMLGLFPDRRLEQFTGDDITAVVWSFPEASRPVAKAALNNLFKWARIRGKVPANPVDLVVEIKAREQSLVSVFSEVEAAALCNEPVPDGVLMRVLLSTGIRRGEACKLQVKHVSFDQGQIEILKGKGRADRLIPLTPTLAGKLDHWFTTDGMDRDDFLWYSRPGGHWRDHSSQVVASSFQRWWSRVLSDAGITYRKPHTTRHTFATRSIRQGVDIDKVRRMLGHQKIATTVETYVHMSVEDMRDDFALVEIG